MRVFVTGATGYIGSAVCRALQKRGHDVVGLARSQAAIDKLREHGVKAVHGNLDETNVLHEMARDADAVITCAQQNDAEAPRLDSVALSAIIGALSTDHESFVYTSGCWVYGDTNGVADETAPLKPTPLVAWRPEHEQRVLNLPANHGRGVVIRPGMVYGGDRGIINGMLLGGARGEGVVRVVGEGKNHWPVVHVDDLAELYVHAVERGAHGAIYNAVNDERPTVDEIAHRVAEVTKARVEHIPLETARGQMGPFADALALDQRMSAEKAKRELDWTCTHPGVLDAIA